MTTQQVFRVHKLSNGITLLGEQMPGVSSAAFSILVPSGAVHDPEGKEGASTLIAELLNRGAGPWNSQQLSDQFESYGIQRGHSSGIEVSSFSGAMLGENLGRALELYSIVLLEPRLPEDALESVKQLALQDLKALEDEPASKVMSELARVFYPEPFGRSQLGTEAGILGLDIAALREHYRSKYTAGHAIISVAGAFD
ncbi:MAG: insulinase family protein [Bdellovibrionales bacterium]|nr:insulinase family protein [Bdellovibrionales bacterium]